MNKTATAKAFEEKRKKTQDAIPEFAVGDTVEVRVQVKEGSKTRIQPFSGIVTAHRKGNLSENFTVRRTGKTTIERIFFLHSPLVTGIKVLSRGKVRRAKLYYLRNVRGKPRIKQRLV